LAQVAEEMEMHLQFVSLLIAAAHLILEHLILEHLDSMMELEPHSAMVIHSLWMYLMEQVNHLVQSLLLQLGPRYFHLLEQVQRW
jgi:hypothetical protein